MAENKVQLKREEPVGSGVSLENIYPQTDTQSVIDPNSGSTMDQVISRLWSAINNKLSRVVNSVNGKTGVVLLTAEDVGLGNVDNISYDSIKSWVIDRLKSEFNDHSILLAETLDDVGEWVNANANNKSYSGKPFYAKYTEYDDTTGEPIGVSHIGYVKWDDTNQTLQLEEEKKINTIGSVDNSLEYNKDDSGLLRVKIHNDEDILYLENDESTGDTGLRLDKNKITTASVILDSPYGDIEYAIDPTTGIEYTTSIVAGVTPLIHYGTGHDDTKRCEIYIDGVRYPADNAYYTMCNTDLATGTIIYCSFRPVFKLTTGHDRAVFGTGMDPAIMSLQPCMGKVTNIVTSANPSDATAPFTTWTIKFRTINDNLGWGLCWRKNHTSPTFPGPGNMIDIRLATGSIENSSIGYERELNWSGLNILRGNAESAIDPLSNESSFAFVFGPAGGHDIIAGLSALYGGGLYIGTNSTLMSTSDVESGPWYDESDSSTYYLDKDGDKRAKGSKLFTNWMNELSRDPFTEDDNISNPQGCIGVSLLRQMTYDTIGGGVSGRYTARNSSGLRQFPVRMVTPDTDWSKNIFGMPDKRNTDYIEREDLDRGKISEGYKSIPGIAVNVGKFLEIDPGIYPDKFDDYYDQSGKVNVRRGAGITEQIDLELITEKPTDWDTRNYIGGEVYYKVGEYQISRIDEYMIPIDFDPSNPDPSYRILQLTTEPADFNTPEGYARYFHWDDTYSRLSRNTVEEFQPFEPNKFWMIQYPEFVENKFYETTHTNRMTINAGKGLKFSSIPQSGSDKLEQDVVVDWVEDESTGKQDRAYYKNQIVIKDGMEYLMTMDADPSFNATQMNPGDDDLKGTFQDFLDGGRLIPLCSKKPSTVLWNSTLQYNAGDIIRYKYSKSGSWHYALYLCISNITVTTTTESIADYSGMLYTISTDLADFEAPDED